MTEETPMIWTTKGNLPIASLTYQTAWDVNPEYVKFMERYVTQDGEVVKESAHVYSLQGVSGDGVANIS
jgi:hypothetical protein